MTEATQVGFTDVEAAAGRLAGVAHRTPVLSSAALDRQAGSAVSLKCENLQRTGSFKFRGAYNAIAQLDPEALRRGVVAPSSGNHAQAVALAAHLLGTTAVIVMPEDAPRSKREATEGYGADVVTYERYSQDRVRIAQDLATERGLTVIPPFDHPDVIAGQGTVALELLLEVDGIEAVVVPVGGGGLIAGSAIAAAALAPGVRVIGVEPEAGDDTRRSLAAGRRVEIAVPRTIADGQAVPSPGELTFEINRRLVDEVVVVSDAEIVAAMKFVFERMKIVAEPSGATAVAAVLAGRIALLARTGVVVSGGNVDTRRFGELLRPG